MSRLQLLIDDLNDTTRVIANLSAEDIQQDDISRLNMRSVLKRRDDLSRKIDNELAISQNTLLEYKIERASTGYYPAKAVGEALEKFQDLLTAVYDALVNGPKRRYRPAIDSISKTTLNFAGATAGSVRITLAAEDERLLVGETTFEHALVLVEKTLSAQTAGDLSVLVQEVGIASVSRAYEWAKSASSYNLKTEISWGKQLRGERNFHIDADDANRVTQLIEQHSDSKVSDHLFSGVLHGFDKQTSYFHIETLDERVHIKGSVGDDVSQINTTGRRYVARLTRTITTFYATGEEKESWVLDQLTPLGENGALA